MNRMIGNGISYANAKTYNNKKQPCVECGMLFNSIDNANECTNTAMCPGILEAPTKIIRKD